MAADDIEGFKYFRPHLEWPKIKLTPEQCRAVKSVLIGETPEEWARKEELRKFMGFEGAEIPMTKLNAEIMERAITDALQVWEWKCPHCPFETDSLTEGQNHVRPGSGCPAVPVGDKKLREAS